MYWLAKYGSPIGYFTKLAGAGLDAFHSDQFYDDIDYGFSRIQMELQSTADSGADLLKLCGLGIFAAVILTGIALLLYRIRPSERRERPCHLRRLRRRSRSCFSFR